MLPRQMFGFAFALMLYAAFITNFMVPERAMESNSTRLAIGQMRSASDFRELENANRDWTRTLRIPVLFTVGAFGAMIFWSRRERGPY
jgi:hypothetical protein